MVTPRVWNGAAWVDKTDKTSYAYWNGAAWDEPADVRYWDGVTWTSIFSGGGGTVSFRAVASNAVPTAASLDITIPVSVQDGDLLILFVGQVSNSTTLFNEISGWTKQGEQRAGSAAFTVGVYTRLAQPGDAGSTVTATAVNAAHFSGQVRAYSGVNQATPLDAPIAFDLMDANVTAYTAPAVTVANSGAMLVAMYGVPTSSGTTLVAGDWTDPTGFSEELVVCTAGAGNNAAIAGYHMATPGTGSQGPFSATITQARRWATATIAIRPA